MTTNNSNDNSSNNNSSNNCPNKKTFSIDSLPQTTKQIKMPEVKSPKKKK